MKSWRQQPSISGPLPSSTDQETISEPSPTKGVHTESQRFRFFNTRETRNLSVWRYLDTLDTYKKSIGLHLHSLSFKNFDHLICTWEIDSTEQNACNVRYWMYLETAPPNRICGPTLLHVRLLFPRMQNSTNLLMKSELHTNFMRSFHVGIWAGLKHLPSTSKSHRALPQTPAFISNRDHHKANTHSVLFTCVCVCVSTCGCAYVVYTYLRVTPVLCNFEIKVDNICSGRFSMPARCLRRRVFQTNAALHTTATSLTRK